MMNRIAALNVILLMLFVGVPYLRAETGVALERIANGLTRPIYLTPTPGDDSRLFIVEQSGRIKILNTSDNSVNATPFLEITGITTSGEQGLLGLAFHPDYATNGQFFVNLTNASGNTEIRRYTVSANPNVASTTFTNVLSYTQPQPNHNGGWMAFNPKLTPTTEQYLYIASGDGGGSNDTDAGHTVGMGNSQDITNNLLGKMLRINVNGDDFPADNTRNYSIPITNPLRSTNPNPTLAAGDDEIWAYGLRNPWRNSFDRTTGDLFIADVGQSALEEINFQPANETDAINYGWRVMEGTNCKTSGDPIPCNSPLLQGPIHTYPRTSGQSITGGYVYRGPINELQGQYFFADYVSNRVWAFKYDGPTETKTDFAEWTQRIAPDLGSPGNIASFAEDNAGNMYLVSLGGSIYKMSAAGEMQPKIATGNAWKYLANGSDQGTAWRGKDFVDATWSTGNSQFGYGESDEATTVNCGPSAPSCNSGNFITTYFRKEFNVADPSLVVGVGMAVLRDDGIAIYVNGDEVVRNNLMVGAGFNTTASPDVTGNAETAFTTYGFDPAMLDVGRNVLAVEIHQSSATSNDMSFDLRLWTIVRTPTPGDMDFDDDVDGLDAASFSKNYGQLSGALWIDGDFNADGSVDVSDLAILQSHLGTGAGSPTYAVPEPTTAGLFVAAMCALACRFRGVARCRFATANA